MIDIIMPCYHAEKYIRETIQSVLEQTEQDFHLICIDDCSKDHTFEILRELAAGDRRIEVFQNKHNLGIAANRNLGLTKIKGEYVAFFDDDDIMPKNRLQIGKEYLETHPEVGVVAGGYDLFDENGSQSVQNPLRFYGERAVRSMLFFENIIPNGTTLIRSRFFTEIGIRFFEECGIEDYHLYAELAKLTQIHVLPEILLHHRVMSTQYSAVCSTQGDKFVKRQESFDRVHQSLLKKVMESDREFPFFLRAVREECGTLSCTDLLKLFHECQQLNQLASRKDCIDYDLFRKNTAHLKQRMIKAYLYQRMKPENKA